MPRSRRFAPAVSPLEGRALLSGDITVPAAYADDPAAYAAFVDSSAADYEIEASAFYIRVEQNPDATAPEPAGESSVIEAILREMWAAIEAASASAP